MTGVITTSVHMMSIVNTTIVTMTITTMTTATIAARTGNTINAKPRQLAGFVLLLVALKHQLAFP